jgi:hypothetical protein
MKKLIILFTITCLTSNLNAQVTTDKSTQKPLTDFELGQYYHQKSKKMKNTGWALLGAGAGLVAGSMLIAGNADFENEVAWIGSSIAFIAGTGSMIASIPVFVSGAKNKGRAEILLRENNIPLSLESKRNIPVRSVGIGIPIRK